VSGRIFLALIGLGFAGFGGYMLRQNYAMMKTWPRADALVIASEVAEQHSTSEGKAETTYWPRVTLKYTVAGNQYVQVAERPGASSGSRSRAQDVVDGLQPGTHHLLPYNPASPQKIYVSTGWTFGNFGFFGVFVLAGFLALLPLLWSLFKLFVGAALIAYQRLKS
jgi:hypothetical protein